MNGRRGTRRARESEPGARSMPLPGMPLRKRLCAAIPGMAALVGDGTATDGGDSSVETNHGGETSGSPVETTRGNSDGEQSVEHSKLVEILTKLMDDRGYGNRRTVGPMNSTAEAERPEEQGEEKKSWKEVWTNKCEQKLPFMRTVFAASNVEPTVCRAVLSVGKLPVELPVEQAVGSAGSSPRQTAEREREARSPNHTESDGEEAAETSGPSLRDTVDDSGKWIIAIRFAKLPGTAKTVWLSEAGKVQGHFRGIIMRAVLRNAQNNPRKYMYGEQEAEDEEHTDSDIPEWLGPRYITGVDVETVLARKQGKGTSKGRRLRKKQVKEVDVACYALEFLYTQLSKVLIYGRRRVDDAFFCRFGYIFVDWSQFPVTKDGQKNYIDQSTLQIRLTAASITAVRDKKLKEIPLTEVANADSDQAVIDARNNQQYEKAKLVCKELVVELEHEVVVREGGIWEKRTQERRVEQVLPITLLKN